MMTLVNWVRSRLAAKLTALAVFIVGATFVVQMIVSMVFWREPIATGRHLSLLAVLLAASGLIGWFSAKLVLRDLDEIIKATRRLIEDRKVSRIEVQARDELRDLARAVEKMAEISLERLQRIEAVLDMAGDGIVTIYRERSGSMVRSFNRAAEAMFGVPRAEVEDQRFRAVARRLIVGADGEGPPSSEQLDLISREVDEMRMTTTYPRVELLGRRAGGETFPVEVSIGQKEVIKTTGDGLPPQPIPLLTLIVRDVSELRRQEAELGERAEQLDRANRELHEVNLEIARAKAEVERAMDAQEVFMANLSHDFRTPLTIVLGYAEDLLDLVRGRGTPYQEDLEIILSAGNDLNDLIKDSSNYFKVGRGIRLALTLKPGSVKGLVDDHIRSIQYLAEQQRNRFESVGLDDAGEMVTDWNYLWRALVNLISNACKFTENGRVALEVRRRSEEGREWVQFRVSDTGIGIPANRVDHLFSRYREIQSPEASRGRTGFGIGLNICSMYAKMLGGNVELERTSTKPEDHGSTFLMKLPVEYRGEHVERASTPTVASRPAGLPTPARTPAEGRATPGRRLLIVDDDRNVQMLLKRRFEAQGWEVLPALTAFDGLQKARTMAPAAIILNVRLPDLEGWSVLAVLKQDGVTKGIPVVLLTGVDDEQKGEALGADRHVMKPFRGESLLRAIEEVLPTSRSVVGSVPGVDGDGEGEGEGAGRPEVDGSSPGPPAGVAAPPGGDAPLRILMVGPSPAAEGAFEAMGPVAGRADVRLASSLDEATGLLVDWGVPDALLIDPRVEGEETALREWAEKIRTCLPVMVAPLPDPSGLSPGLDGLLAAIGDHARVRASRRRRPAAEGGGS